MLETDVDENIGKDDDLDEELLQTSITSFARHRSQCASDSEGSETELNLIFVTMTKGSFSWLKTAWLIIILFVINDVKSEPFSGPNITSIGATNSTSINVSWGEIPAMDADGYITHYYVCYKVLKAHRNNCSIRVDGVNKRRTILNNLNAFTTYVVTIKAATSNGAGPPGLPKRARTLEDIPAKGPTISRITPSSRTLDVTWSKLSLDDANGVIRKYEVCFSRGSALSDCSTSKILTGVDNSTTDITGLTPVTLYTVAVRAFTEIGYGPLGGRMSVTTHKSVNIKPTRTASMNAARHKSTSNSITLTSTMMIGATTSQITTSQNVPPSNRSSLVVPSASPTTIPSALSTVNVTTDTCTSTCVVHQDSLAVADYLLRSVYTDTFNHHWVVILSNPSAEKETRQ